MTRDKLEGLLLGLGAGVMIAYFLNPSRESKDGTARSADRRRDDRGTPSGPGRTLAAEAGAIVLRKLKARREKLQAEPGNGEIGVWDSEKSW
jgi:hypothetical protein